MPIEDLKEKKKEKKGEAGDKKGGLLREEQFSLFPKEHTAMFKVVTFIKDKLFNSS